MRYMILVKATKDTEAGVMPTEALIAAMATYHEELAKAGVLLDGSGLQASSKGWRIQYAGESVDGNVAVRAYIDETCIVRSSPTAWSMFRRAVLRR